MIEISPEHEVITLINVFSAEPDRQQELVELLTRGIQDVISKQPGYVSASIHRGVDGGVVAMYVQWRSAQDFLQVGGDPEVRRFRAQISDLATFDPDLFDVVFAHHR
jgi:quinol monooxygenase YgiN